MKQKKKAEYIFCRVCGYYCLGKGGVFCIDKPFFVTNKEFRLEKETKTGLSKTTIYFIGFALGFAVGYLLWA